MVSGFIDKELLHVKGDGQFTLKELVETHPRARYRMEEMEHRHGHRFDRVIPTEKYFIYLMQVIITGEHILPTCIMK